MSKFVQKEQQFVTAVLPLVYVVAGLFLFTLYEHPILLVIPLCLLLFNPVLLLRFRVISKWSWKHIYLYCFAMWLASLAFVGYTGLSASEMYLFSFFIPIGYAALFFSRRSFLIVICACLLTVTAVALLTEGGLAQSRLAQPFTYGELTLFAFVIFVLRVLYSWSWQAKQFHRLSLVEGDRNNPRNQRRLNTLFGFVYFLLHVVQWPTVRLDEIGLLVYGVLSFGGLVVWIVISYVLYEQPGRALQPLIVLLLMAICTMSFVFFGLAYSLLYPYLYLLPVMFISFNTSRKVGMGAGLLALVLALCVLWATPGMGREYTFGLFVYGFLFFFMPQVIGYSIRTQMLLLKQRSPVELKAEWYV